MKRTSLVGIINKKVFVVAFLLICVSIGISYLNFNSLKSEMKQTYKKTLLTSVKDRLDSKFQVGITNAVSIAANADIKVALSEDDRDLAIEVLSNIGNLFKENTNYKNIKVHVHTKDVKSFVRIWKLSKYGDDLTSFRHTINKVKATNKPVNAVEIGRAGLTIRAVVPINDEFGYIGSLEFMQGFNSISKSFARDGQYFAVLLNGKFLRADNIAKISSDKKIKNYILSQKHYDKAFVNDLKTQDLEKLKRDTTLEGSKYFLATMPIKDFEGKVIGMYVVGDDIKDFNVANSGTMKVVIMMLTVMILMVIIIMITIRIVLKQTLINGLEKFKKQFDIFLDFAQFKTNRYVPIEVKSNDEISQLILDLNKTGENVTKQLQDDMKVIGELTITTDKVEQGIYKCKIHSKTSNPMIQTLASTINKMINAIESDMTQLKTVVEQYANDDFRNNVTINPKLKEHMLSVMQSINVLGNTLRVNAKTNLSNGQTLNTNAVAMSESVQNVATKANQQAASLEETAAAVEEITSITRNNAQNSTKMAELGELVKNSANQGNDLANQTATSMDDINNQVGAISEAISVIDQISFQTNILSLNAAVEAATAGEAGKGFAVVAQEVRNLASRSAEAANEIKTLVESATQKANDGKRISSDMINGYETLNKHINETIHIIDDVSNASKEQMTGIEQINDAVTMLDRVTQENANEANIVANISDEVKNMANDLVSDAQNKKF